MDNGSRSLSRVQDVAMDSWSEVARFYILGVGWGVGVGVFL